MKNQATKNQATNAPYLSLVMGSALAMSQTTTMAQIPPPLINGLPPAPPVPENDTSFDIDTTPLPPVPNIINSVPKTPVTTVSPADSYLPTINIPVSTPTNSNNQTSLSGQGWYRVDVFGDSPMMLAQVQKVEPKAFIRSGEGVIQVGIFSEQANAQRLRSQLEAQGLRTQIIGMSSLTNKPSSNGQYAKKRGYFVIIPGSQNKLDKMIAQILDSGVDKKYISMRNSPRGNHIGIGPFDRRTEAHRWNAYFRSLGMDARVYFGR